MNEIMLAIVMRADPNLILFFVSPSKNKKKTRPSTPKSELDYRFSTILLGKGK